MAEVEWEKLSSKLYEDMVATLLSHMNPRIRRIDGSGGDGGRDAEFPRKGGPEIYQLKGFTGRMNGGRRGQVKSSLKRAAKRDPVAWHLVVPIDPTPAELEWFEGLQGEFPFPLQWDGRTWLNGQMAERPFIPRYFVTDERDRVLEMLTQLRDEQASVDDIQTGLARMKSLAERINEIDPYYRFDVAVRDDTVEAVAFPRYEGAELDRPITVNVAFAFPDSDEGRTAMEDVQHAMDYGSPVEVEGEFIQSFSIDGPAGFGDTLSDPVILKFGPSQPPDNWELKLVLRVVTTDDIPVATLPLSFTERTQGRKGFVVRGSDRPGTFAVEIQTDVETRDAVLNFKFSANADHYPHDLLPALTFMRNVRPPNKVQILVGPDSVPLGEAVASPNLVPIEDEYVRLVEDLSRLQRETGTFFTMPAAFSNEDARELAESLLLLEGKEVAFEWTKASMDLILTKPGGFLETVEPKAEAGAWMQEGEAESTIAGHLVPLGKMRTYMPSARISNIAEIKDAIAAVQPDDELTIAIVLEAIDKTGRRVLVPR